MAAPGEADLVAVLLPATQVARVAPALWGDGAAILPLDPAAPPGVVDGAIAALRPTHLLDADGRRTLADGVPVGDDVAAVVATSGTGGTWGAKAAELTRTGMEEGARAYCGALGATSADRWLGCLAMHHVAGLAVLPRSLVTGIPATIHDGFDLDAVSRSPRVDGTTIVLLVPTMLRRLLDAGAPLHEFRLVLVGAGPLPDDLRERAADAGARTVNTYGMTEAWGGVAFDGVAIPGVEIRLADGGEILVRGPNIMKGYRLRPDLTAAVFDADGWYRTGDVGEWDGGILRVVDRRADLVKTGGVSVAPSVVEHVLGRHPGVADVAVVGAPDPEWGERVVACVVARDPGKPPSLADLRAFARDRLPASHLPREVRLVAAVPRSASGKARRAALRAD
jgi:O-succinylbenzoic acid--CoA ligase